MNENAVAFMHLLHPPCTVLLPESPLAMMQRWATPVSPRQSRFRLQANILTLIPTLTPKMPKMESAPGLTLTPESESPIFDELTHKYIHNKR